MGDVRAGVGGEGAILRNTVNTSLMPPANLLLLLLLYLPGKVGKENETQMPNATIRKKLQE